MGGEERRDEREVSGKGESEPAKRALKRVLYVIGHNTNPPPLPLAPRFQP